MDKQDVVYINSINKNKINKNSQSNGPGEKMKTTVKVTDRFMERVRKKVPAFAELPGGEANKLWREFVIHFLEGAGNKKIRNFPAYVEKSFVNWLGDRKLREELQAAAGHGGGSASYDLSVLEALLPRLGLDSPRDGHM